MTIDSCPQRGSDLFVSPDIIRAHFSAEMSIMYQNEVPLYGDLLALVADVNSDTLAKNVQLRERVRNNGSAGRLDCERHGAIRVGTAEELRTLRRLFAVMGLYPVGYYDLAPAGIPVHSTAFRPITDAGLEASPFRVFTSLLRLDLVEDASVRARATEILSRRQIVLASTVSLIDRSESQGGLTASDAARFIAEAVSVFRWQGAAAVDIETYASFNKVHRLVADVVSFRGPHINHLTPRTLDIDEAQAVMRQRHIPAKARIEGPPHRAVPILLRQTSFHALEERVQFVGDSGTGTHTARFGEIEQRGAALTRRGRHLYDRLLASVVDTPSEDYDQRLIQVFEAFPDSEDELRDAGLAYFRYSLTKSGLAAARQDRVSGDLSSLIEAGFVSAEPLTYEDFLPVSAAGIFRSNLSGFDAPANLSVSSSQAQFEADLGTAVADPFELYETAERRSLDRLAEHFPAASLTPVQHG